LDFAGDGHRLAPWTPRSGPASSFPDDHLSFARSIIALLPILAFGEVRRSSAPPDGPGDG
jgi:hypothetical protein